MIPQVTVAIPLYNARAYVAQALRSVQLQTFMDFEVIVVDDGSTDDGHKSVAAFSDPRITCLRQPNSGPSAARNVGIRAARGTFIAFLDADDLWRPDHLAILMEMTQIHPSAGLFGNSYTEMPADWMPQDSCKAEQEAPNISRILDDYIDTWARGPAPFHTSTSMVNRSLAVDQGGFREGFNRGEDLEFFVRMALAAPVAVTG